MPIQFQCQVQPNKTHNHNDNTDMMANLIPEQQREMHAARPKFTEINDL